MLTSNELPQKFYGSAQHRSAADLSDYVIHMTKSEQDLASILTSGVIRAKNSFGLARGLERLSGRCRAACFTEMPVSQISRLAGGGRCWGLAFKKNFIVENGGQRVWYVDSASELFGAASALKEEKLALRS